MKAMVIKFWLVGLFGLGLAGAHAATHYLVPTNAGAANPYTNWATAGTSYNDVVRAAMTNAAAPRIVWVTNGIYVLTNSTAITNDVVVQSVNGRDVTIFNGNATYRFALQHSNCVMAGLTISNCYNSVDGLGGGGMRIYYGTVTNCLITDCVSYYSRGGGITISPGIGVVATSTIRRNRMLTSSYGGGGIYTEGTALIMNCIIESNFAYNYGGGIMASGSGTIIRNCLIRYNNGSSYGGGISIGTTNVLVANCTIVSNYAATVGGINLGNFVDPSHTNMIVNCIIVSNSVRDVYDMANAYGQPLKHQYATAYCCSTSNNAFILDSRGNTTNAPGFIDFQGGNYLFDRHSPCFNSGTNQPDWMSDSVDLVGRRRILHGQVDMGAYELFIPGGTMFRVR